MARCCIVHGGGGVCVYRLLVQDLSDESLLGAEAVLEGRPAERNCRHRRRPPQKTPRTRVYT